MLGTELRHRRTTSYTSPRVYGYNDETLTSKLFPNGTGKLAIKDLFGNTITVDDYASTFTFNTDRFFSLYGMPLILSIINTRSVGVSGQMRRILLRTILNIVMLLFGLWEECGIWDRKVL